MYPFTKITAVPGAILNGSPARCNRKTKEVWTNKDLWPKLTETEQKFILYHEAGHIILNTRDEVAADEYAFQRMTKEGESLKGSVRVLTHLLSNSQGHRRRAYIQLQRAKAYDILKNNKKMNTMLQDYQQYNDYQESFLGLGKRNREFRKEKRALKLEKWRSQNRERDIKADARILLAQQGVDQKGGGGVGGFLKGAANLLGTALGGGSNGGQMQEQTAGDEIAPMKYAMRNNEATTYAGGIESEDPKKEKNKTMMIVAGAIAAVLILLVVILKSKK